jgi:hypothetical protein
MARASPVFKGSSMKVSEAKDAKKIKAKTAEKKGFTT